MDSEDIYADQPELDLVLDSHLITSSGRILSPSELENHKTNDKKEGEDSGEGEGEEMEEEDDGRGFYTQPFSSSPKLFTQVPQTRNSPSHSFQTDEETEEAEEEQEEEEERNPTPLVTPISTPSLGSSYEVPASNNSDLFNPYQSQSG
jgi:hypothetical protein